MEVGPKWWGFPICPGMSRFVPVCPPLSSLGPRTGTNRDKRGQAGTRRDMSGQIGKRPHLGSTPISSSQKAVISHSPTSIPQISNILQRNL